MRMSARRPETADPGTRKAEYLLRGEKKGTGISREER